MLTPRSRAARTVWRMTSGSPAWKPQATLALPTRSSKAGSLPICQAPKHSQRSALRLIFWDMRRAPGRSVTDGGLGAHDTIDQIAGVERAFVEVAGGQIGLDAMLQAGQPQGFLMLDFEGLRQVDRREAQVVAGAAL